MSMNIQTINEVFDEHQEVLQKTKELTTVLAKISTICTEAISGGHKILICGNGGSAADAQHIAAEFVGRFLKERKSLPAIALTTDSSILTSVANDYSYDVVFARQVEGLGQSGDVLIGISTSGNSKNVNLALEAAREKGIKTIGFTGRDGGKMRSLCDEILIIPSNVTARIQEMHIMCGHIICQMVDEEQW